MRLGINFCDGVFFPESYLIFGEQWLSNPAQRNKPKIAKEFWPAKK